MKSADVTARVLGIAFLLQAITSLVSGVILKVALTVPGDIARTMINIANHAGLMRANILGEMLTAAGVVFLGSVLFFVLRKQNELTALIALGLYLLEMALLVVSRIAALSVLHTSQEYVAAGHPASLQAIGKLALEFMDSGYTLLMVPFGLGAILFYYLLYTSRIIPRGLSLWGLLSVALALAATLVSICGYEVSFALYLPYLPFEFVVGVWILVRGLNEPAN